MRVLLFLTIGSVLVLTSPMARSQSFTGTGPVQALVMPTEQRGPIAEQDKPASDVTAGPVRVVPEVLSVAPKPVVRRLPANLGGTRFVGEWATSEWAIYLTAAQAQSANRFRLETLSAISVLPEASGLTVIINDRVLHQQQFRKVGSPVSTDFAVPAGLVQPGYNAVRVIVHHRHRVDCAPAATQELWTSLDPSNTGFVLAENLFSTGHASHADLAALVPAADGSLPIRVRLDGKLPTTTMQRALRAAQLVALSAGTLRPSVSFGEPEQDAAGVTLVVGTRDELAALSDLDAIPSAPGGSYGFATSRPGQKGLTAPVFVVTGASLADLDQALDSWAAALAARTVAGTAAGVAAARRVAGLPVTGDGDKVTFAMSGLRDMAFTGRMLRVGLDLALPADILPADYDRLVLNLAGSHSDDLDAEANILVEVNGQTAATQKLGKSTASSLDRNEIFLPLRLLRPGHNRVEITAQTSAKADAACSAGPAQETRRLELLASSSLSLPRIARVGRTPELAVSLNGSHDSSGSASARVLHVPAPGRQTMAAAATLTARIAVAAGRPVPYELMVTPPNAASGDVLVVSPAPTLDPDMMRQIGLDPERIRQAWQAQTGTVQPARRPRFPEDELSLGCTLPQAALPNPDASAGVSREKGSAGLFPSISLARLWQMASLPETALPRFIAPLATAQPALVSSEAIMLLSQGHVGPSATWTVVTAASPAALALGVNCLTSHVNWAQIGGQTSVLRADETVGLQRSETAVRYFTTQAPGISNLRLVAAGWLSLNPIAYVSLSLLLGFVLAAATLWLVRNTGRRQECSGSG